jgi:hypothetical protein
VPPAVAQPQELLYPGRVFLDVPVLVRGLDGDHHIQTAHALLAAMSVVAVAISALLAAAPPPDRRR